MKNLLLPLLLLLSLNTQAANQSLPDLLSPDAVARELGLPMTDYSPLTATNQLTADPSAVDVYHEFPVVVVINTAETGPSGQRLKVYENGVLTQTWLTSTGREQWETDLAGNHYFTNTPAGWYAPISYEPNHWSEAWQAPMKWSIFFNGGIAVHATTEDHYDLLGHRASGGCVRLTEPNAKILFDLSVKAGRGSVPSYTRDGKILVDSHGQIIRHRGSNTLFIVVADPQN